MVTALHAAIPDPNQGLVTYTYTSCPTIFGVKKADRSDLRCAEFNEWAAQQITSLPSDVPLFIVNRTSGNVFGSNVETDPTYGVPSAYFDGQVDSVTPAFKEEFQRNLVDSACELAKDRKVYLIRPIPEMLVDVPRFAARKALLGKGPVISISEQEYADRHEFVKQSQDLAAVRCDGVDVLDPTPFLCEAERCAGVKDGRALYYDSHHLSEHGNKLLVPMFTKALQ